MSERIKKWILITIHIVFVVIPLFIYVLSETRLQWLGIAAGLVWTILLNIDIVFIVKDKER